MIVYVVILFFALVPGILFRFPPKSSPLVVAAVHAVIFAVIYHFGIHPSCEEQFQGAWVKMADGGWSNDSGVSTTYCDKSATFSPGPPATCINAPQKKPFGSFTPVCPKGKIFLGGAGLCADPAPPYGNKSPPACPGGVFDPSSSTCLPSKLPIETSVDDEECPPGCAPIDEEEED
jgi:hypothetical protein